MLWRELHNGGNHWALACALTVCSTYRTIAIMGEKVLIILLVAVNLAGGFGFAAPIARLLGEVSFNFGIPGFLPWPLNTILGFCVALLAGAVVLKAGITVGEVSLLIHRAWNCPVGRQH